MKRTLPLIVLIGAAGLLVPVLGVSGESPTRSGCKPQWASGCYDKPCASGCCTKPSSDSGNVIDELTAILKETKSAETFVVTAMVLGRMGAEAKQAIPVIIRNAERLELLDDLYHTRASADNHSFLAQEVIAALDMILDKKAGTKGRIWQNQPAACYSPYAPATSYSSPLPASAPSSGWNTPYGTSAPPSPVPVPETVKPTSDGVPIKPVPAGAGQQGVLK